MTDPAYPSDSGPDSADGTSVGTPGLQADGGRARTSVDEVTRDSPEAVVARLTDAKRTVACAESLTGGLLTAALTDGPGASKVVLGGVVAYVKDVKRSVLGVSATILEERGAVDPDVAEQLARGVRRLLDADYGVSTTGVAGPGPADGKPEGTVYVAVAGRRGTRVRALELDGGRDEIRAAAVLAAVSLLGEALEGDLAEDVDEPGFNEG